MSADVRLIDTGTEELLAEVRERVGVITLNRPERRNALSDNLSPALRHMLEEFRDDPAIGAVLLTGAGSAFCAGGDVTGMGANSAKARMSDAAAVADLRHRQNRMTGALATMPKPTVALLPGPAAGAGLALALACDIRIAAESAFVTTGYARVGLSGDYGIAWMLTAIVGTARAREFMFTGERIPAARALELGLVNRVLSDEALREEGFAFARELANGPSVALGLMKDNLNFAAYGDFQAALDREAANLIRGRHTADHHEAVRAFIEKRAPAFTGR